MAEVAVAVTLPGTAGVLPVVLSERTTRSHTPAWRKRTARAAADVLRGQTFGALAVTEAKASVDTDADGDLGVYLDLTLSDPPGDAATWRLAATRQLRAAALAAVSAHHPSAEIGVYVRLAPATHLPQDQ